MYDLYFFELNIFETITCRRLNVKNILRSNKLSLIRLLYNIVFYIEFARRIRLDILDRSTIDITY